MNLILQLLLLFLAFSKFLLKKFYLRINLLKFSFLLPQICHLLLHCLLKNCQLTSKRFSLSVHNVVLIHTFDPHLKIFSSKRWLSDLIKIKLRSCYNSCLQPLNGSIWNVIFIIDLDHLDQTHQIFHQKFTTHLEIILFSSTYNSRLLFFIDNLTTVCHNPIPEKYDQSCAYSNNSNRRVIEALNFIQVVFLQLLDFL